MFVLSPPDVTQRYDSVFWFGDLNFRLEVYTGKTAVENIVTYIEEQEHSNFEDLVQGDQLTKLIIEGRLVLILFLCVWFYAFQHIVEGSIYSANQKSGDSLSFSYCHPLQHHVLSNLKKLLCIFKHFILTEWFIVMNNYFN